MKPLRTSNRLTYPDAWRADLVSPIPPATRQPSGLSAILDLLPPGGPARLDPAVAREVVAAVVQCMEALFLPQPATTVENHARCYHHDLPGLSDQELRQELDRAAFVLAWSDRARWHPWVLERSERCRQELQRRQRNSRRAR